MPPVPFLPMTLSILRISAAFVLATVLPAGSRFRASAYHRLRQARTAARRSRRSSPASTTRSSPAPTTTRDDRRRTRKHRQHGASMQEISEAHKDLLRNLIDQQLWLSKGQRTGHHGRNRAGEPAERDPQAIQPGVARRPGKGRAGTGRLATRISRPTSATRSSPRK